MERKIEEILGKPVDHNGESMGCTVIPGKITLCNIPGCEKYLEVNVLLENTSHKFLGVLKDGKVYSHEVYAIYHGSNLGHDAGGTYFRLACCEKPNDTIKFRTSELVQACNTAKISYKI